MNRGQYEAELARILRALLVAGSKRDWEKLLELANDIENLVIAARDGSSGETPG